MPSSSSPFFCPIAILVIMSFSLFSSEDRTVLTYEPAIVELTGTLDLQTFPGPPNYESIKKGDALERHFYLKLDQSVDVLPRKEGHPTLDNADPEMNVTIMMLAISSEDSSLWTKFRKTKKGSRVKIKGTLYHRWTGHHHSRVVLSVTAMETL